MIFKRYFTFFLSLLIFSASPTSNLQPQGAWEALTEKEQSELVEAAYSSIIFGFNDSLIAHRLKAQPFAFDTLQHTFFLEMVAAACASAQYIHDITTLAAALTEQYNAINTNNRHYQRITNCNAAGEITVNSGCEEEAQHVQIKLNEAKETKKSHERQLKQVLRNALRDAFNAQDTNAV